MARAIRATGASMVPDASDRGQACGLAMLLDHVSSDAFHSSLVIRTATSMPIR